MLPGITGSPEGLKSLPPGMGAPHANVPTGASVAAMGGNSHRPSKKEEAAMAALQAMQSQRDLEFPGVRRMG
jgi:hypothetical protein